MRVQQFKRLSLTVIFFLLTFLILYYFSRSPNLPIEDRAESFKGHDKPQLNIKVIKPVLTGTVKRNKRAHKGKQSIAIRIFIDYSHELHKSIESINGVFFIYDSKNQQVVGKLTPELTLVKSGFSSSYISGFRVRGDLERTVLARLNLSRSRYRVYLYIPDAIINQLRRNVAKHFGRPIYAVANITLTFRKGKLIFELNKVAINNKITHVKKVLWSN